MKAPWFVVKRYGFGLSPSGWKGWACTAVFIVLVTLATVGVQRSRASAVSLATLAFVVLAFTLVMLLTSDGKPWRWRRGGDDDAPK
ncbi:MAG TPA: hypothetical protein VFE18_07180 [Phenylobacterium sp.]|jgi:uncharacterized membrane protein YccC|uniref:hypothetical protein n=1 Tax=Phenylobacterium sp. TaxID=1871053 RepID=UPI002D686847|nr:hypothetical protein [Phenylobacterium sp.]HZZ67939.1 hypothetical protein [Phenylobacterium sp.]